MEANEISIQQAKVFLTLKNASDWLTNHEVASAAGVPSRTVRAHTKSLIDLGFVEQVALFPDYRLRLSEKGKQSEQPYVRRLNQAIGMFGLVASDAEA